MFIFLAIERQLIRLPFNSKFFIWGLLLISFATKTSAQGNLLVAPRRLIFDGSKKNQEINLANVGTDTAVYAISIIDIRMKEDGSFEQITDPDSGQNFAGRYLRFYPRRVVLAPNEAQVVKVQLIKTNELMPGEYRSHMYFRSVPNEKPLGSQNEKKDTLGISVNLVPIFGITVPVIIRVGDYAADVSLSDLSFQMNEAKIPVLNLTFHREGNMSVYGDIKVDFISERGKTTQVKLIKGIGVYTPNSIRHFKVELDNNDIKYSNGKLHVTYSMQMNDKSVKLVEAELSLK